MAARGEDRTDWATADAMSQEEVERLADAEDGPLPEWLRADDHDWPTARQGRREVAHRPRPAGMVSWHRERPSDPHQQRAPRLRPSAAAHWTPEAHGKRAPSP